MQNLVAFIIALLLYSVYGNEETIQQIENGIGYQCGYRIFTNEKIKEALKAAFKSLEKKKPFPAPFKGTFYKDDSDYLMWPIKAHGKIFQMGRDSPGPHLIIINRMREVVDMVVRISDYSFMKCSRYDPSIPGTLEPIVEDSNGYQCGNIFISDKISEISRQLAIQKLGSTHLLYPKLVKDPLYQVELEYMIWPIWKAGRLYSSGSENGGPLYIVIDPSGKLIDVVARAVDNSFLKCLRNRKVESASPNEPSSKLFVPPPISGFHCGRIFFREDYVNKSAEIAAIEVAAAEFVKTTAINSRRKAQFPEKYEKGPFPPESLLWPLSISHKPFIKGSAGKYRVVMSPSFKVLGVIIKEHDHIYRCEKAAIKSNKDHDTNDYTCFSADFSHAELVSAADAACTVRNSPSFSSYPAIYNGPNFDIKGPYFTYPVLKSGRFVSNAGKYRVVINTKCEVVGALFKTKGNFVKCRKKMNGKSTEFKSTEFKSDESVPKIREKLY